jgi:hypothetical protein
MLQALRMALIIIVFLLAGSDSVLKASSIAYYGSNGSLAASVSFDLSGPDLTIVLTNTSQSDVLVPANVLTGLGFNADFRLSPFSVSLNEGSSVYYINKGVNVNDPGKGWGYGYGVNALGMNSAISASGAVTGLGHSNFSYDSQALGGLDYGILSLGDDISSGNQNVTKKGPLFKNSLVFTLSAPEGFTLEDIGSSVRFFYGTKLNESPIVGQRLVNPPTVPEPSTFILFGTGILLLLVFAKRRSILKKLSKKAANRLANQPYSID